MEPDGGVFSFIPEYLSNCDSIRQVFDAFLCGIEMNRRLVCQKDRDILKFTLAPARISYVKHRGFAK